MKTRKGGGWIPGWMDTCLEIHSEIAEKTEPAVSTVDLDIPFLAP